jgi:hypothetical protein
MIFPLRLENECKQMEMHGSTFYPARLAYAMRHTTLKLYQTSS